MTTKVQPQNVASTAVSLPSATPNLTDWHTWVALLTSIAALVSVVLHADLSAYVPLVAIGAATLTNVFLMITKHHYAAALVSASSGTALAASVAPTSVAGEIKKAAEVVQAVQEVQQSFAPIATAVAQSPANRAATTTPTS